MKYDFLNVFRFMDVPPETIEKIMISIRNGTEAETPYDPSKQDNTKDNSGAIRRYIESDKTLVPALKRVRGEFKNAKIALDGIHFSNKPSKGYGIWFDQDIE